MNTDNLLAKPDKILREGEGGELTFNGVATHPEDSSNIPGQQMVQKKG